MLLNAFLTACAGAPADSAEAGPNAPEIYLLSPAADSTWDPAALIPVTGVLVDDGTAADALRVTLTSDRDGALGTPTLTPDGELAATIVLTAGIHTLTIEARDAAGHTATRAVTVSVDPDGLSQPAFRIDPAAPVTGDPLTGTIVMPAVDPDGTEVTYLWAWTVDTAPTELTGDTVPADRARAGETWTATLTATSGADVATPLSRSVLVENGPPVIANVVVTPAAPDASTPLVCTAGPASDPEDDPFTVTWSWERNELPLTASEATLPAASAVRGDRVRCGAVLTDDQGSALTTWSAPVTLANLAPSVESVEIEPTAGDVTTAFRCRAHRPVDPDLDVVTVTTQWTGDDAPLGDGGELPAGTPRGTSLRCLATPDDGIAAGSTVTSSPVVVGNAPPTAPRVIDLGDVAVGSPAACAVAELPVDADDDPVELTWTWEVDGVVLPADGPAVPTTGLAVGAVLTCTATPDDGRALGPSDAASLSLTAPTRGTLTTGEARVALEGSYSGGQFGKVVDDVPDLDGDGYAELLVGAPHGDGGTQGAVFLFTSTTLGAWGTIADSDADATWVGHADNDLLGSGRGAGGAGDVDGDGVGDLLAAAPYADVAATDGGEAYLLSGAQVGASGGGDVAAEAVARFRGAAGDWLGVRVAGGDLDGDGLAEVMLGAPYRDTAGDRTGSVLVWRGGAGLSGGSFDADSADAEVTGVHTNDQLGWSLAWSADGDGDGYGELITGVFLDDTNGADAGAAVAVSGRHLDGVEDYDAAGWLIVHGTRAGDHFGYDVAGPGDVDGDGLADLLFGAYMADPAGADSGAATLWYGRAGINHVVDADQADTTFVGTAAGDLLGGALDGAGDFDGDGLADLTLGAARADTSAGEVGRAWLELGSDLTRGGATRRITDAPLELVGDRPSGWFGDELAGGLDVDQDGYGEMVVGAQGADGAATNSGVVWIYEGP